MLCSLLFRENGVNSDFFLFFFFVPSHDYTFTRLRDGVRACVCVCVRYSIVCCGFACFL